MEMLPRLWSLALPATVAIRTRAPAHHQVRELQRFVNPSVDGVGFLAKSTALNRPVGVAVDTAGDVYVADWGNNRVVKLAAGRTLARP
jgi:glucose/arabinose dehydrogenase